MRERGRWGDKKKIEGMIDREGGRKERKNERLRFNCWCQERLPGKDIQISMPGCITSYGNLVQSIKLSTPESGDMK